ncbi:protein of unknown function [Candidatus Hydrogenisulfobacillus filiaventi]|uniref:Uncharacterized protein n=1 Tax=Candidatus Hydrogenisulfobacillus filiaventi TaxID=2707344 RepID=A0A6F8ZJ35_9FIRM|nr:hypothetical protein [Bacillota bacterium]CAB1129674.1 protein of unknown function [Candidatus Hydrogenisulfobacillus filiaventi]
MLSGPEPPGRPGWGGQAPPGRIGTRVRWIIALTLFAGLAWMHEHPRAVPRGWAALVHRWVRPAPAPAPQAAAPGGRWPAPLAGARLRTAFGWQGRTAGAGFAEGVWVQAPAGTALGIPVSGRVVAVERSAAAGPWVVEEAPAGAAGTRIMYGGLVQAAVRPGRRLPGTVGTLGGHGLWVAVTVQGLPVDPLARGVFGPAWRP